MKNKEFILLVFLISIGFSAYTQSNADKAKAYYFEAQDAYSAENYTDCINHLNKVEELLGSTNAKIINLKVKTYYSIKEYQKAKIELEKFSKYSANAGDDLIKETLSYLVKIESELEAEQTRKREAETKRKREAELAEARRKKEREAAEIQKRKDQLEQTAWEKACIDNTALAYQQFLVDFPNGKYKVTAEVRIETFELIERQKLIDQDFDIAKRVNTISAWKALLPKYPSGKENKLIREKISHFEKMIITKRNLELTRNFFRYNLEIEYGYYLHFSIQEYGASWSGSWKITTFPMQDLTGKEYNKIKFGKETVSSSGIKRGKVTRFEDVVTIYFVERDLTLRGNEDYIKLTAEKLSDGKYWWRIKESSLSKKINGEKVWPSNEATYMRLQKYFADDNYLYPKPNNPQPPTITTNTPTLLTADELKAQNYISLNTFYNKEDEEEPDQFPMYANGTNGLLQDIYNEIAYPDKEYREGIEGVVIVQYVIEKDGTIADVKIKQSVSPGLDNEAIRVVKSFKRFHPAFKNGEPVRVSFNQPFNFKIPTEGN